MILMVIKFIKMSRTPNAKFEWIKKIIPQVPLNLTGLTVLTELGSNDYMLTPLIAELANAKKVIAWVRDSQHGLASDLISNYYNFCKIIKYDTNILIRPNERPSQDVMEADIITNSSMIRPFDRLFLENVKKGKGVISLMFESWELRNNDIDLKSCQEFGVRVCGVSETLPEFNIFGYVQPLAVKMALAAGYEIYANTIIVWSTDQFGEEISYAFKIMGAKEVILTAEVDIATAALSRADFVFFADYHDDRKILNTDGIFPLSVITELSKTVGFVHLCGDLNPAPAIALGYNVYPKFRGYPQKMTHTLSYAGPIPLIKLMCAGLKAGEEISKSNSMRFAQPIL